MKIIDFIPPVIVKRFIKQKRSAEEKQIEYENYNEALKNSGNGYEDNMLCRMIADKTVIHKKTLLQKPYSVNAVNIFLFSALYQYCNLFHKNEINVLDFGGACGAHYFETKQFFPKNINFHWNVIETPEMVISAKEHNLENNELYFADDFTKISTPIDFIYSSGALQYVPNAYEYLTKLIETKADYILFNRMMFNENDRDFITIQESRLSDNGPGKIPAGYRDKMVKYPHTTLSLKKFNEKLEKQYKLEWTFDERSGVLNMGTEKITGRGLLYIKIV